MSTSNTKLQVPIAVAIKTAGEKKAREIGFGSLNQAVRLFVNHLARGDIKVSFSMADEVISEKDENSLRRLELRARKEKLNQVKSGSDLVDQMSN